MCLSGTGTINEKGSTSRHGGFPFVETNQDRRQTVITWLKRKLQDWLLEDEPQSRVIQVIIKGEVSSVIVESVVGLRLCCKIPKPKGGGQYLISDSQACSRKQFWRLWKQMGGVAVWKDGKVFKPSI